MGKMTREQAIETLAALNKKVTRDRIIIYVDAMLLYQEANENIARNGAITAHPRTGAPMENPYLKVRIACAAQLSKFNLNTGDLWDG
jgi:hypothetical protein